MAMHEHERISGGDQRELFQTGPIETLKEALLRTDFLGYDATEASAEVKGIIVGPKDNDRLVGRLAAGGDANHWSESFWIARHFTPKVADKLAIRANSSVAIQV